jgi:hypothetical protein
MPRLLLILQALRGFHAILGARGFHVVIIIIGAVVRRDDPTYDTYDVRPDPSSKRFRVRLLASMDKTKKTIDRNEQVCV